jgi:hypothetical protein
MVLGGIEHLDSVMREKSGSIKMVLNERGALFFSNSEQHRSIKADGISYEDDYRGNALAAIICPGRIEIRFHKAFSDRRVATIIRTLLGQPAASLLADCAVTYQGRTLDLRLG